MNKDPHLRKIELKSWQYEITTDYWIDKIASIVQKIDKNDLELKEILNKLQPKCNKNILSKFISILSSEYEISTFIQFDIKKFLTQFTTDEWILNEGAIDIMQSCRINFWTRKLGGQYVVKGNQRSVSQVVHLITTNSDTSSFIHTNIKDVSTDADEVLKLAYIFRLDYEKKQCDGLDYIDLFDRHIKDWKGKLKSGEEIFNHKKALAYIILAIQFKTKNEIMLRNTQIISILTLWKSHENTHGVLTQLGTGEGKTFVAIALAILKVLIGQKVHILTSSSVLAERDATSEENCKIFKTFGLTVNHNCYDDAEKRKESYTSCNVIYGVLGNFQRDYLLAAFNAENLLTSNHFQNVIVDEVDSMLLDRANNILYLSQDIPDIDEIESVFKFIWQWINQQTDDKDEMLRILETENVRKVVLDNAYGMIEETQIERMLPVDFSGSAKTIISSLQANEIIDNEGVIIMNEFDENSIQKALGDCSVVISNKIKFFIKQKIEAEKDVKIPKYMRKFVTLHLRKWIQSAVRALFMQNNKQFTIDRDHSGTSASFDPSVIIVDLDTGTDQSNSQWDEGLHQFLQLKYGCKLSMISLKSVFISNVSYFKLYDKIYGLSGTLGTFQERQKLEEIYELDFVTIPTYLPKKFIEYESIMTRTTEEWLEKIQKEILDVFSHDRSVLIICETIVDLEMLRKKISNDTDIKNVHIYQRDYEKFDIEMLEPKTLIIATNLAGKQLSLNNF